MPCQSASVSPSVKHLSFSVSSRHSRGIFSILSFTDASWYVLSFFQGFFPPKLVILLCQCFAVRFWSKLSSTPKRLVVLLLLFRLAYNIIAQVCMLVDVYWVLHHSPQRHRSSAGRGSVFFLKLLVIIVGDADINAIPSVHTAFICYFRCRFDGRDFPATELHVCFMLPFP